MWMGVGFTGLRHFAALAESAGAYAATHLTGHGYGPLVQDPAHILDLPRGFSYRIISRQGTPMIDGLMVPGKADGMATFAGPEGKTLIIRNHELSQETRELGPFGAHNERLRRVPAGSFFDTGSAEFPCIGGTTTMVYDTRTGQLDYEFLSLVGTIRNCAGGPTPWGTWLTCEETVDQPCKIRQRKHGYVFEVPASATPRLAEPVPITAMGRFQHEAVAIDPLSGVVYLTEDRTDSLLYRFLPNQSGKLHWGGRLQALVVQGQPGCDTRNWPRTGAATFPLQQALPVTWIDLDRTDAPDDDLRMRGHKQGAALFARGEGIWYGNGACYVACTNGGYQAQGQIFRYVPSPYEGQNREREAPGQLELFLEPNKTRLLENCDNLTVSPGGDLIVCEDRNDSRLVGITPEGHFYVLGVNVGFPSEFAGAVFSPDGSTLFVNIQHAGLTLAITGPWHHSAAQTSRT